MSVNGNLKKNRLLGEPHGTAASRLRKMLLFRYVQMCGDDNCYRCGSKIETIGELSIEHKTAWQGATDPKAAFFNLDDVGFSHLRCNTKAVTPWNKKYETDEERRIAHNKNAAASKSRNYSPAKRRQAYLDGRW